MTPPWISRLPPPALLLLMAACVTSVSPIYTDDTLVEEAALVGTWAGSSGDVLKVTPGPGKSYGVAMIDQDGTVSAWTVRVTRIGGLRWVDVEPQPMPSAWSDDYRGAFLPLHQFWILRRADSLLSLASINSDSLRALLAEHSGPVSRLPLGSSEGGDIILAGTTAEIRELLADLVERPGFIEEGDESMRRVR